MVGGKDGQSSFTTGVTRDQDESGEIIASPRRHRVSGKIKRFIIVSGTSGG